MAKTILDYIADDKYERYKELTQKMLDAKAALPKTPRAPRGPMTTEQKAERTKKQIASLEQKLAELLAAQNV